MLDRHTSKTIGCALHNETDADPRQLVLPHRILIPMGLAVMHQVTTGGEPWQDTS